jgi:hypothetical protein
MGIFFINSHDLLDHIYLVLHLNKKPSSDCWMAFYNNLILEFISDTEMMSCVNCVCIEAIIDYNIIHIKSSSH